MLADWNVLSEDMQLFLSHDAMRHAAEFVAGQAETLAREIELGTLSDQGGPDALRLLAAIVSMAAAHEPMMGCVGHA